MSQNGFNCNKLIVIKCSKNSVLDEKSTSEKHHRTRTSNVLLLTIQIVEYSSL